jgi:hypothetical protein
MVGGWFLDGKWMRLPYPYKFQDNILNIKAILPESVRELLLF